MKENGNVKTTKSIHQQILSFEMERQGCQCVKPTLPQQKQKYLLLWCYNEVRASWRTSQGIDERIQCELLKQEENPFKQGASKEMQGFYNWRIQASKWCMTQSFSTSSPNAHNVLGMRLEAREKLQTRMLGCKKLNQSQCKKRACRYVNMLQNKNIQRLNQVMGKDPHQLSSL